MRQDDLIFVHAPNVYDFRRNPTLFAPAGSQLSLTPVLEIYPLGLVTLCDFLERSGFQARVVNLALLMVRDRSFDAAAYLASLKPKAFGLDMHWLAQVQGTLAVATLLKRLHPEIPIIFIGCAASHYHEELAARPEVDFVVRGDSAEEPLKCLLEQIVGSESTPLPQHIPNLTWQDASGPVRVNAMDYLPMDLDHVRIDYSQVIRSAVRNIDWIGALPFFGWLRNPVVAVISGRSRRDGAGSEIAAQNLCERDQPALRRPAHLAADVWTMSRWSRGTVFVLGDIRSGGENYVESFLSQVSGVGNQLSFELLTPASRDFLQRLGAAAPNFCLEMSPESHDETIRGCLGRNYVNADLERTIADAWDAGCKRIDLFFRVGLPGQTRESVLATAEYCGQLLEKFCYGGRRLVPCIYPLAPFLEPGGPVFAQPEKFGYRIFGKSLEEHRLAQCQPSWKQALNYETNWLSREEIVNVTYEAQLRLCQLKLKHGLIGEKQAAICQENIRRALRLTASIDAILAEPDEVMRNELFQAIKYQVEDCNFASAADRRRSDGQHSGLWQINFRKGVQLAIGEIWRNLWRKSKQ